MADSRGKPPSVNERLQRLGVRHAVYWQRLRAQQVKDALGFMQRAVLPDVRDLLANRLTAIEARGSDLGPATTSRLLGLELELRSIVSAGLDAAYSRVADNLFDLGVYETEWQARLLRSEVPIEFDFQTASPVQIRAAIESQPFHGAVMRDWFTGIAESTQQRVGDTIRSGIIEGRTTQQIVARILGDEQNRGDLGQSLQHVETIVRTAATHVAAEARDLTYQANDDIVKGWQFLATLDTRTSLTCAAQDGREYALGEGTKPPLHPNCRSTSTPILKSFEEIGLPAVQFSASTRASMNGQVPDKLVYGEWIKDQPAHVQDEALGATRAAELRAGRAIEDFVRRDGSPLTIAELKALDS